MGCEDLPVRLSRLIACDDGRETYGVIRLDPSVHFMIDNPDAMVGIYLPHFNSLLDWNREKISPYLQIIRLSN